MTIQHISPNYPTDKGFQPGTLYLFDYGCTHDCKNCIHSDRCNAFKMSGGHTYQEFKKLEIEWYKRIVEEYNKGGLK